MQYVLNSKVITKKPHPCGNSTWIIVRVGADIKIKCEKCGHVVMLSQTDFQKRVKSIIEE